MTELFRRLRYLLNRGRFDQELADDLEFHREMAARDGGVRLGDAVRVREDARAAWGWTWIDRLGQDIRYAARMLWRSPGFTLTAVVMLAIGIGANIAAFGFLNLIVLRPLPVRDPDTLLRFERRAPSQYATDLPYAEIAFVRSHATTLSAVIASNSNRLTMKGADKPISVHFVTANFFEELGTHPRLGRALDPRRDDTPEAEPVVVLSHGFWQRQYRRQPRRDRHDAATQRQGGHHRRSGRRQFQRPELEQPGSVDPAWPPAVLRRGQPAADQPVWRWIEDVGPHAAGNHPRHRRGGTPVAGGDVADPVSDRHLGRRDAVELAGRLRQARWRLGARNRVAGTRRGVARHRDHRRAGVVDPRRGLREPRGTAAGPRRRARARADDSRRSRRRPREVAQAALYREPVAGLPRFGGRHGAGLPAAALGDARHRRATVARPEARLARVPLCRRHWRHRGGPVRSGAGVAGGPPAPSRQPAAPGPDRRAGRRQLRAPHRRRSAGACSGPRDVHPPGLRLRARDRDRSGAGGTRLRVGFGPVLPGRTAGTACRVAWCGIRGADVHAAAWRPSLGLEARVGTATGGHLPQSRHAGLLLHLADSDPARPWPRARRHARHRRQRVACAVAMAGRGSRRPAVRGQHRRRRRGQRPMGGAAGSGCGGDVLPRLGQRVAVACGDREDQPGRPRPSRPWRPRQPRRSMPGSFRTSGW